MKNMRNLHYVCGGAAHTASNPVRISVMHLLFFFTAVFRLLRSHMQVETRFSFRKHTNTVTFAHYLIDIMFNLLTFFFSKTKYLPEIEKKTQNDEYGILDKI